MYNGWKNRATWNVALWIQNDEALYHIARKCKNYSEFRSIMRENGYTQTLDGISYQDSGLDIQELDEMIGEL